MTTPPDPTADPARVPTVQLVSAIFWPSFILAGVATAVFFTFMDPLRLFECEGEPPLSRLGAYSLGFLGFWLLGAACAACTAWFLRPEIPRAPAVRR